MAHQYNIANYYYILVFIIIYPKMIKLVQSHHLVAIDFGVSKIVQQKWGNSYWVLGKRGDLNNWYT
jgi:hypothetical protein